MSGKDTSYRDWYETLSSEEQKKHKTPDEMLKSLTEPNPSLASLPTAKDFFEARFQKDMVIYRLGLRADEMNIISKLDDIRQAVIERNLEYANMALQYLIIGLKQ